MSELHDKWKETGIKEERVSLDRLKEFERNATPILITAPNSPSTVKLYTHSNVEHKHPILNHDWNNCRKIEPSGVLPLSSTNDLFPELKLSECK